MKSYSTIEMPTHRSNKFSHRSKRFFHINRPRTIERRRINQFHSFFPHNVRNLLGRNAIKVAETQVEVKLNISFRNAQKVSLRSIKVFEGDLRRAMLSFESNCVTKRRNLINFESIEVRLFARWINKTHWTARVNRQPQKEMQTKRRSGEFPRICFADFTLASLMQALEVFNYPWKIWIIEHFHFRLLTFPSIKCRHVCSHWLSCTLKT